MAVFANLVAGVVNSSGASATGMLAYFYQPGAGSTTLKTVYTDADMTVPASNPYTLDGGGRATLYGLGSYRIRVTTSAGVEVQDIPEYDVNSTYADLVALRDAAGYVGTGSDYTGTTVDAALQAIKDSAGALDAKYRHEDAASTVTAVTLQAKLSRTFDVKDFGATGLGTASDATYVQAAITACVTAGGGTVWFPAGTYRIDTALTIGACSGVTLLGDGGAIIRQYTDGSPSTFTLISVNASTPAHFRDLTFYGHGSGAAATSIGILIPAGNTRSSIRNCHFSGNADGEGFNIAISLAGSYTMVTDCTFQRIYHATSGCGIRLNGAAIAKITACDFTCVDSSTTRCASAILTTAASSVIVIEGCYIAGAAVYGLDLGPASATVYTTDVTVRGTYIGVCQGGGIRLTECDDTTVEGCDFDQNLVASIETGTSGANTGGAQRLIIKGNRIVGTSASGIGIYLHGAAAAADTDASRAAAHPTACVVEGNVIESCGTVGIQLSSADDCIVSNNIIKNCSLNSSGTHPAIKVTTNGTTATTAGGSRNYIHGNTVRDSATSYHHSALSISDSSNGIVNITTTIVGDNNFVGQNAGGTIRSIVFANNDNSWGSSSVATVLQGRGSVNQGCRPFAIMAADTTLTTSHGWPMILLVDTGTAGSNRILTLPDFGADDATDVYNGFTLQIAKYTGTDNLRLTASGTNNIFDHTSGATTTSVNSVTDNTASFGITITYYNGTWYMVGGTWQDWD